MLVRIARMGAQRILVVRLLETAPAATLPVTTLSLPMAQIAIGSEPAPRLAAESDNEPPPLRRSRDLAAWVAALSTGQISTRRTEARSDCISADPAGK